MIGAGEASIEEAKKLDGPPQGMLPPVGVLYG
jgi:hypothetical protein